MDPISHTIITRAVLRSRPLSWRRAFLLGNWPDIGYYTLYPTWLVRTGQVRMLTNSEAPVPPRILLFAYNLTHSLLIVALLAKLLRRRVSPEIFAAWTAHILLDAPTHSRRIYATRFLWPLSQFAFDGWSWAEILHERARRRIERRKAQLIAAVEEALPSRG